MIFIIARLFCWRYRAKGGQQSMFCATHQSVCILLVEWVHYHFEFNMYFIMKYAALIKKAKVDIAIIVIS